MLMIQQYTDLSTNATELRFCLLIGIGNKKFKNRLMYIQIGHKGYEEA